MWSMAAIRHPLTIDHTLKIFIFLHTSCWFNKNTLFAGCQMGDMIIILLEWNQIRKEGKKATPIVAGANKEWIFTFRWLFWMQISISLHVSMILLQSHLSHGVFLCCAVKAVLLFHTVRKHQSYKSWQIGMRWDELCSSPSHPFLLLEKGM